MLLLMRSVFSVGGCGWKWGLLYNAFGLFQRPCYAGSRNLICLCQLSQAQSAGSIAEQGWAIDLNGPAAKLTAFEPGTAEPGANPFNNKVGEGGTTSIRSIHPKRLSTSD
jgi:hypothetical protein